MSAPHGFYAPGTFSYGQVCHLLASRWTRDEVAAVLFERDTWIPGGGGYEEPMTKDGRRVLWCWNPGQRRHAYIDLGTDMEVFV